MVLAVTLICSFWGYCLALNAAGSSLSLIVLLFVSISNVYDTKKQWETLQGTVMWQELLKFKLQKL